MAKAAVDQEGLYKDGSCEISVYMMNQIYKVGINSVVMEDKGDQIVENGPIGVL